MKVRVRPADTGGCARYRCEEPARIAAAEHEVVVLPAERNFTLIEPLDPATKRARGIHEGEEVPFNAIVGESDDGQRFTPWSDDVLILQRPAKVTVLKMMEAAQRQGIAVVVDVDDDYQHMTPALGQHGLFNPNLHPDRNWHVLRECCRKADLVTVSTDALVERYGSHGRVAVLKNCVPEWMLGKPSLADGRTVGWPGIVGGHPGDLQVVHGGVAEAMERVGWHYHHIGDPERVGEILGISGFTSTGTLTVDEYRAALPTLDVGLCPLEDNAFNRAKSWLKPLELAAVGVPCVMSPTPEYEALRKEGIGLLAKPKGRSWRSSLLALMQDPSRRQEMAAEGRQAVANGHTYEHEGWRWQEAWEAAIANARERVPCAA